MKIQIKFLWYDFWVGFFWDRDKKILYFCPLPMVVLIIKFEQKVSIPVMITNNMRILLRGLGYEAIDISQMKPEEAHQILRSKKRKPITL